MAQAAVAAAAAHGHGSSNSNSSSSHRPGLQQQQQRSQLLQLATGFVSTLLWCFASSTLIVVNSGLYKGGFPYPMMVTGIGQVRQGVCGRRLGFVTGLLRGGGGG
jgi:hypothetical protein